MSRSCRPIHALGSVKRRYQGAADTSPARRIGVRARARPRGRPGHRPVPGRDLRAGPARCAAPAHDAGALRRRHRPVQAGSARPSPGRAPADLSVGRLVERKGFEDLIGAMAAVPGAEWSSSAAAAPSWRRPVRAAAAGWPAGCGVADRVRLVGAVPPDADAALVPLGRRARAAPWYEPFGLTPLEAMACGVPVVGHRGRRAHRHRGARGDRRPGAAPRPAGARRRAAPAARRPAPAARATRPPPGTGPASRYSWRADRQPAGSPCTPAVGARAGAPPGRRWPDGRHRESLLDQHVTGLAAALAPVPRRGAGTCWPAGARGWPGTSAAAAGCWSPATAAAPPRRSTWPPSWSASYATTARRCPRSRSRRTRRR